MMTINYQFVAVHSNWASVTQQRGKFMNFRNLYVRTFKIQLVLAEDPFPYRKIVLNDEAYFWLNGYVNKQHCRFYSEDKKEALQKLSMHLEKVTVCWG